MKTALFVALIGALFVIASATCPLKPDYTCVKNDVKKCTAVEVCEEPVREACGATQCAFPYVCATEKKKECFNFIALKKKCQARRICKEILKPCGYGYCGAKEECVKETVCKKGGYGRKLMNGGAGSSAAGLVQSGHNAAGAEAGSIALGPYAQSTSQVYGEANSGGATIHATSSSSSGFQKPHAPSYAPSHGQSYAPTHKPSGKAAVSFGHAQPSQNSAKFICNDEYKCVVKQPCKDIIIKKCVKAELRPGYDLCEGGRSFHWFSIDHQDKCGYDYCGHGFRCAEVFIKKCDTECDGSYCGDGYECAHEAYYEEECKDFAFLETICKDIYEPVCIKLPYYIAQSYEKPCKTIFACEKEESACGYSYCPYGSTCAVTFKKACGNSYYTGNTVHPPAKHSNVHPSGSYRPYPSQGAVISVKSTANSNGHKDNSQVTIDGAAYGPGSAAYGAGGAITPKTGALGEAAAGSGKKL